MASEKVTKQKISQIEGTPFLKYELDDNQKMTEFIEKKEEFSTERLKILLKPAMEKAVKYVIMNVFKKFSFQLAMEQRHECVLIDSEYPMVADQMHDINGLFEMDEQMDFGKIQRISNFLMACRLDLKGFDISIKNGYYFVFMINRNVKPFSLLFLGHYFNDNPENANREIFIDALVRSASDVKDVESDLSKRKKQKHEYAKRSVVMPTFEEKITF